MPLSITSPIINIVNNFEVLNKTLKNENINENKGK